MSKPPIIGIDPTTATLFGLGGYSAYRYGQRSTGYASPGVFQAGPNDRYDRRSAQPGQSKIVTGLELILGAVVAKKLYGRLGGAAKLSRLKTFVLDHTRPFWKRTQAKANKLWKPRSV